MKIELLYFDGCSSWEEGLENLKAALALDGIQAEVELVRIEDNPAAERLRFLGSPSFRVDGRELWEEKRENYALSCRVYRTPEGLRGSPTVEMLRDALKKYSQEHS